MSISRRDLLRAGGASALFGSFLPARAKLDAVAKLAAGVSVGQPTVFPPKVFTFFLRGAFDGVHSVVPLGDGTYTQARPSASMQPSTVALNGTSYAELNADLSALLPIDAVNEAAFIHQCGNPVGERSHFVEQQVYESAFVPGAGQSLLEEGVLARLSEIAGFGSDVPGASVSKSMQRFFRGFTPNRLLAHVPSIEAYTLGASAIADRQRAALAQSLVPVPNPELEKFVHDTAEFVLGSEDAVQTLAGYTRDAMKFPVGASEAAAAGLNYYAPGDGLMLQCADAVELLLATGGDIECQAIGVEFGGWDTHRDQDVDRPNLDPYLGHAIRSVYDCAKASLQDFVILVVSEFGRTNYENSKTGTDHGVGGLMMAFGPRVNGGVYNCDAASWRPLGGTYTQYPNAQPVVTDFRLIYAELFRKLFGLTDGTVGSGVEQVIPGWTDTSYLGVFN